jgi:hypothetical protein
LANLAEDDAFIETLMVKITVSIPTPRLCSGKEVRAYADSLVNMKERQGTTCG